MWLLNLGLSDRKEASVGAKPSTDKGNEYKDPKATERPMWLKPRETTRGFKQRSNVICFTYLKVCSNFVRMGGRRGQEKQQVGKN